MKFFRVKPAKERKVVFLRKRWLAIPGALLCICALCLVTTLPSYVSASTTERQLPIYCVQRDYKTCALSFDAAWGNEDTQTLIDIFDKYNVKVTFFVVGECSKTASSEASPSRAAATATSRESRRSCAG